MPENRAISFSDMYVGNATKAFTDIDDDQLKSEGQGFYVYGGNIEKEDLFNGEHVTYSNGTWVYDNIQYWTESTYKFAAYAPKADGIVPTWSYENGQISLTVTSDKDHQNDLIYDKVEERTVTAENMSSQEKVSLEFDHILSQIVIKFNSKLGDRIKLEVTNLKINGKIATTGTYDGAEDGQWSDNSATGEAINWTLDPITIEAADEDGAGESRILVIPQTIDGDITLSFDLTATNINNNGGPWTRKNASVKLPKTTITEWAKGFVYTYTADIKSTNLNDMYPINFDGTVSNNWTTGTEGTAEDVTIPNVE